MLAEQNRRRIQDLLCDAGVQPQPVGEVEELGLALATRRVAESFRRLQDDAVFVQQLRQILLDLTRHRDGGRRYRRWTRPARCLRSTRPEGQFLLVLEVGRQEGVDRASGVARRGLVLQRPVEGLAQGLVISLKQGRFERGDASTPARAPAPAAGDVPNNATSTGSSRDVEILAVTAVLPEVSGCNDGASERFAVLVPSAAGDGGCSPAILDAWRASRLSGRNSCGAARAGRWAFRGPGATPCYSCRSATSGSTRDARYAGSHVATSATMPSAAIAIRTSRIRRRQAVEATRDQLHRARGSAPPTTSPAARSQPVSRRIIAISVACRAPSALRTPSSCVRRATP